MRKLILSISWVLAFTISMVDARAALIGQAGASVGTAFGLDSSNADWVPVIISGGSASGGGIPLATFTTTADSQKISVTFTAVCDFSSPVNTIMWVRFTVDGATMLPRQTPLCRGRGTVLGAGDDVSTVTAFYTVPTAGSHEFRVDAKIATWSLTTFSGGYGKIQNNTTLINN